MDANGKYSDNLEDHIPLITLIGKTPYATISGDAEAQRS